MVTLTGRFHFSGCLWLASGEKLREIGLLLFGGTKMDKVGSQEAKENEIACTKGWTVQISTQIFMTPLNERSKNAEYGMLIKYIFK